MIELRNPFINKKIDEIGEDIDINDEIDEKSISINLKLLKSSIINYTLDLTNYDLSTKYVEYIEKIKNLSVCNNNLQKIFDVNVVYVPKNITDENLDKLQKIFNTNLIVKHVEFIKN
jgi:hypothetical protein